LHPLEIAERPLHADAQTRAEFRGTRIEPRPHRRYRVRGEVGTASVERQFSPAAAEGRQAAIAILQIEQPAQAVFGRVGCGGIGRTDQVEDGMPVPCGCTCLDWCMTSLRCGGRDG
jgi:hypothetical protein